MYVIHQLRLTSCITRCMCPQVLQLPEDGRGSWPKQVLASKLSIVQLVRNTFTCTISGTLQPQFLTNCSKYIQELPDKFSCRWRNMCLQVFDKQLATHTQQPDLQSGRPANGVQFPSFSLSKQNQQQLNICTQSTMRGGGDKQTIKCRTKNIYWDFVNTQ